MMRLTKLAFALVLTCANFSASADDSCEKKSITRDDYLACTNEDTKRILNDAEKLYENIRGKLKGKSLKELDRNHELWDEKSQSDCKIFGMAFNDWTDNYMPDTDFQVAACLEDAAKQRLEFYEWLSCPGDMESSEHPECSVLKRILGKG
ncbi:hypothetical protein [Paraburkholderia antibiotica]|uniref:DUF1311 domain-containing protein n=1 Tax=Paraburkholderia antibiotica TaxID=2728839 RepID=A0A7X9X749_9BURK|nr:hypothetical protein [Paraburkholderia antibiotica]NML32675.1 DUF1311 domain-containing protein [Paraburkholderia antibiotica]